MTKPLNANYVFFMLAKQGDAVWGPAATFAYIASEHAAKEDKAKADAIKRIGENLSSHLSGCSLSAHPVVIQHRTKAGRKEAKRERKAREANEAYRNVQQWLKAIKK